MGKLYDATWGRGFSALYDRLLKATEEAGLREMRRETLSAASGRTIDLGAGTGRQPGAVPRLGDRAGPGRARPAHGSAGCGPGPRRPGTRPISRRRAESLPFEDSSFDTAVFTLVLCTVPTQPRPCRGGRVLNRAAACCSSSTSAPRIPASRAGRTGSKGPGASSVTAATATATRWRGSRPPVSPRGRRARPSCRSRRRSSGPLVRGARSPRPDARVLKTRPNAR